MEELYDHAADLYEHQDLAGTPAMKAVIQQLAKSIQERFEKSIAKKEKGNKDE